MSDMEQINAETWRAASVEAYRRAGMALCDASHGFADLLAWQERAVSYARRAMILDSNTGGGRG